MHYVGKRLSKHEEIPPGFIEYIYERDPGKALVVFAYANALSSVTGGLESIHNTITARREGREKTPEEIQKQRQAVNRQMMAKGEKSEILLAEHIVSNAIWLKENEFADRFQRALPEAQQELKKLAEHDQWWARLYVAEIMRQHPELRIPDVMKRLSDDDNELVSKAAKSVKN
jgi:hypothetical protein